MRWISKIPSSVYLTIILLIIIVIVGWVSYTQPTYTWHLFFTATAASLAASILYEIWIKNLINT